MSRRRKVPGWGRHPSSAERFHGVLILWQQPPRPLAPGLSASSVRKGSGSGASPAEQFHGLIWRHTVLPRRADLPGSRMATPTCAALRRRDPGRPQTRFRRVQAQLPSPSRGDTRLACSEQHLQAPSDIGGSGGAPRQATAWETEARSVAFSFAGIVNTEGPGP
jgi:hypothetical protein